MGSLHKVFFQLDLRAFIGSKYILVLAGLFSHSRIFLFFLGFTGTFITKNHGAYAQRGKIFPCQELSNFFLFSLTSLSRLFQLI